MTWAELIWKIGNACYNFGYTIGEALNNLWWR